VLLRILLIMAIIGWTFAAQAAESSSLREHADITEWAAKGLIVFFQFEIWRNQRTLFKKHEETAERVAKIEGICQGRKEAGEKCV
jgi:hypothetical protein